MDFSNEAESLIVSTKFPDNFAEKFIDTDRNILNNFGVLQFESSEGISRIVMIFSEEEKETGKKVKIILV